MLELLVFMFLLFESPALKLRYMHSTKNEGLRIWSHLLKKSLMEKFIFYAVMLHFFVW